MIAAHPFGSRCSIRSSVIPFVILSWFWSLFACMSRSLANLLIPTILSTGMYATWARQEKGWRWCSQVLWNSMSLSSTMPSYPSALKVESRISLATCL